MPVVTVICTDGSFSDSRASTPEKALFIALGVMPTESRPRFLLESSTSSDIRRHIDWIISTYLIMISHSRVGTRRRSPRSNS